MIELNAPDQAIDLLSTTYDKLDDDVSEKYEVNEVTGTAYKQKYLAKGDAKDILQAIDSYRKTGGSKKAIISGMG